MCADDNRVRVYAFSSILEVEPAEDTFVRPVDFDLSEYWKEWRAKKGIPPSSLRVKIRLSPLSVRYQSFIFDRKLRDRTILSGQPDAKGHMEVEMLFDSFEEARNYVLSMGNGVKVLEPETLRLSVHDYASRIKELYETREG